MFIQTICNVTVSKNLMMALPAETCNQGTKECSDCDKMNMYHHHHHHRRNLANNIGGEGQNRPWVLGTLIYEGVKLERGRLV